MLAGVESFSCTHGKLGTWSPLPRACVQSCFTEHWEPEMHDPGPSMQGGDRRSHERCHTKIIWIANPDHNS